MTVDRTTSEHRPVSWTEPVDPLDRAPEAVSVAWSRAHDALAAEDLETALQSIREAIACVPEAEEELLRRLICGRVALEIECGVEVVSDFVRGLLSAAESTATAYLAAYQMARILELQRRWKKALYYARVALSASEVMGIDAWSAAAENMIGNVLVAESRFDEAESHYRRSIELCGDPRGSSSSELDRAQASDNLAFTLCCLNRASEARPLLATALRTLRATNGPARLSVELDAAVLHLRQERPDKALGYAERALERSRELGDERNVSNALLLVSESAKRLGSVFLARRALSELEDRYDAEFAAALSHFDVLELVNFRA